MTPEIFTVPLAGRQPGARGSRKQSTAGEEKIFSACAGAAIYCRKVLLGLGLFDEEHFAYLEDLDICYRARLHGYGDWYLPKARVRHVGSGTSGSRYNLFKVRYFPGITFT